MENLWISGPAVSPFHTLSFSVLGPVSLSDDEKEALLFFAGPTSVWYM